MATCHDCKVDYAFNLDRHHIIPRGTPGAEDPSNLVDICPNCHRNRHRGEAADSLPWIRAHTPEANAKRTETMRKRWQDPDYRARQLADRASRIGVPRPPGVGAKVSAALKGKPFTAEHRAALSRAHKGIPVAPETRAKISAALKGRPRPAETVARMTGAQFRPHEGQCTCCGETEPTFLFARKGDIQHCRNCWKATRGGRTCPHERARQARLKEAVGELVVDHGAALDRLAE